jgi:hypothetical protein
VSRLVELARFADPMAAAIAEGLLAAHGIGAVLFDTGMNIADSAAFAIPVRLMVLDEDRAAAAAVLAGGEEDR